jgi:hypothetical protein
MSSIDPLRIATVLLAAPAWAKRGLAVQDERLRERAADVIATIDSERLTKPEPETDARQMALPIL